jgi:uncharacterized coiled-coil DUF342 family protein
MNDLTSKISFEEISRDFLELKQQRNRINKSNRELIEIIENYLQKPNSCYNQENPIEFEKNILIAHN